MIGGVYLDRWADLGAVTDLHLRHVQYHAIEVEKDARTEADVETVVAMKGRSDHGAIADCRQALQQQRSSFSGRGIESCIVARKPALGCRQIGLQFGIGGVVQFASKHFLLFSAHQPGFRLSAVSGFTFAIRFSFSSNRSLSSSHSS